MNYNKEYNHSKTLDRKKADVTYCPHLFDRSNYWDLDLDLVEEVVRSGKIFPEKCERPNKFCFKKYFGKYNIACTVIVRYHSDFIEVKTAWKSKGR